MVMQQVEEVERIEPHAYYQGIRIIREILNQAFV